MIEKTFTPNEGSLAPRGVDTRMFAVVALLVLLVGLAGFAGWFANGDTLFWSLLQTGLAWCL